MIRSVISGGKLVRTVCDDPREEFDIIVAGGGTAGAIAALAAASRGMRTLVLEKSCACGGIGTGGLVSNYYYGIRHGTHTEIDESVRERERNSGYLVRPNCFSPELKKIELEQRILRAGGVIRFEAVADAVLMRDDSAVGGLSWHEADGPHSARCRYVIDATADAQIVFLAGGAFRFGRDSDGLAQTYTLNYSRLRNGGRQINYGDGGYVNPSDSGEVTDEILHQSALLLKERFTPEDRIDFLSDHFCVREGRRIVGEANLTLHDVIHGVKIPEAVAWERSNCDTHNLDLGFEDDTMLLWCVAAMQWGTVLHIPVPRGALIPKGLHGILVAGRMLAVDHDLSQAVRMKDCMQFTGEAAAVMASLAVRMRRDVRDVPYERIAAELAWQDFSGENEKILLKHQHEIVEGLRSPSPGRAIWSAYRRGESGYLEPLLRESGAVRAHAAFALALLRHPDCLGVLRELAERRDATLAETPRGEPHRQEYGAIAAYLLGFLHDKTSVGILSGILRERRSATYAVNAWNALTRIGEDAPELRPVIGEVLEASALADSPPLFIRCFGSDRPLGILNRMRILTAAKLDRWGIPHGIHAVLDRTELTAVEKGIRKRCGR